MIILKWFWNFKKQFKFGAKKNNGNENLIKNLNEICNNNNKKIIELEAKVTNLENYYKKIIMK